ncbi:hypothetical protein H2248_002064 [Termitomyces sp. 'cryptogamus']|nr:hypothetical protein H2248_002064 [Termitomyces sp. 'cryptogamus']
MIYTQPILSTPEADTHSLSRASIPSLPIIVTAFMIFLIVDAVINLLRRHKHKPEAIVVSELPTPEPHRSLTCFVDKSRSILEDFQVLEKQLAISNYHCLKRSTHKRKRRDRRLRVAASRDTKPSRIQRFQPSCEFTAFCDQLLLTNKIWRQEKELKALRAASDAKSCASRSTAFTTFCEQLLLWNRVWQLEREAAELVQEKERIRRERVAAVTRAAKRMVQDVQKERMVEEFVKDLIEEVGTTKAEMGSMKEKHEREVEDIQGEWAKDYRKVREELEQLKLAQSARLAEQELSNSLEESLFERIEEGKRRVKQLEEGFKIVGYASSDETLTEAETSDAESELVSDLSSSTCVSSRASSVRRSPTTTTHHIPERKRCTSQEPLPACHTSQRSRSYSVTTMSVIGSSLGTLVVDQGKPVPAMSRSTASVTRTINHSGRPLAVRSRKTSVKATLRMPPTSPASGSAFAKSGSLTSRAPWKL